MQSIVSRPLLFKPAISRNRKPIGASAASDVAPPLLSDDGSPQDARPNWRKKHNRAVPIGQDAGGGSKRSFDFTIRKLLPSDLPEITRHLTALDQKSRRLRFGHAVSDAFLCAYAVAMFDSVSLVYGAEVNGRLRGVAEIRGETTNWINGAEAALSVEERWQNHGIGSALLKRLVLSAKNRSIEQLYMVCLRENAKMQHLAAKNEAILQFDCDQVEGRITNLHPSFASLASEFIDEASSYMRALYRVGDR